MTAPAKSQRFKIVWLGIARLDCISDILNCEPLSLLSNLRLPTNALLPIHASYPAIR